MRGAAMEEPIEELFDRKGGAGGGEVPDDRGWRLAVRSGERSGHARGGDDPGEDVARYDARARHPNAQPSTDDRGVR